MDTARGVGLAALLGAVAAGCATGGAATELRRLPERPDALVQLRRAGCASGACPVYSVSIFADRTVIYEGAAHVAVVGQQRATISGEQLRTLQLSLEQTHFLDNTDECCVCPDATPKRYVVLDYRPGLARKRVVHDPDCPAAPAAISTLEGLIEGMTGVRQWAFAESAAPAPGTSGTNEMSLPRAEIETVSTVAVP
jgi:hypothetical protein